MELVSAFPTLKGFHSVKSTQYPLSFSFHSNHKSFKKTATITNSKSKWRRGMECRSLTATEVAPAAAAVYGTLLLGGGLFAYGRTGSKGSLSGGISGGALLALTYYLMGAPETKPTAYALGFGAAFLFSAVFGIRIATTRKPFPSGPLLVLSLAALSIFATSYLQGPN